MDLVVGALSGMVDALPGKLGELLEQEYALLSGARVDVVFLQTELRSMRAAILHCESLDHPDAQTGAWVGRVRELAYDIEDWVDLFGIRVDAGGSPAANSSRFIEWIHRVADKVATLPARHVIANELKELKERVIELSEQRNRYSCMLPVPAASRPMDPRLAALFVDAGSLVGLDGPVGEVSQIVMDTGGRTEPKIVSIVGMAGAGKTTLANAVYQRLKEQFECHAFVSVGMKPETVNKVLTEMLSKLDYSHRGGDEIGQLIGRLRELLGKKRYLIVIDDLWSSELWGTIKCCFSEENNLGSRIIITTRKETLAAGCSSSSGKCIYKIGLLGNADAKNLFLKKAFRIKHDCPQYLEDVSTQILNRCGGLPLAVVSIATKLAHRQSRDEWERLGFNSMCSSDPDGVKHILNLSYNDLPAHLRTCLLYLSIFPEDSEVDTERLVRRWIAEGFIAGAHNGDAKEIARHYLNDLISRNLVQPLHLNHDKVPRRCKVHPMIHDFIVCKSMEENFATLVDSGKQHVPTNNDTIRRLSLLNCNKKDKPADRNECTDLSHARSITVLGHASATPHLTDLKVVRVLDLEGCSGPVCLDGLCKLLLLRYLSLRGTDVNALPATIGELKCLETLDVGSTKVKELPPSIVRMSKLMHLLAENAKLPGGVAKMTSLQTLSCSNTTKSSVNIVKELSGLAKLRELELFCDATEMLGDEKQIMFQDDGFQSVKQLCIRCISPSVTFKRGALPVVEVLQLRFEKGLADESCGVSGIEHLSTLKHVHVDFSQHNAGVMVMVDAGAMATVDAVRKAVDAFHTNRPELTVMIDGKTS